MADQESFTCWQEEGSEVEKYKLGKVKWTESKYEGIIDVRRDGWKQWNCAQNIFFTFISSCYRNVVLV